jgi:hypothetical protein
MSTKRINNFRIYDVNNNLLFDNKQYKCKIVKREELMATAPIEFDKKRIEGRDKQKITDIRGEEFKELFTLLFIGETYEEAMANVEALLLKIHPRLHKYEYFYLKSLENAEDDEVFIEFHVQSFKVSPTEIYNIIQLEIELNVEPDAPTNINNFDTTVEYNTPFTFDTKSHIPTDFYFSLTGNNSNMEWNFFDYKDSSPNTLYNPTIKKVNDTFPNWNISDIYLNIDTFTSTQFAVVNNNPTTDEIVGDTVQINILENYKIDDIPCSVVESVLSESSQKQYKFLYTDFIELADSITDMCFTIKFNNAYDTNILSENDNKFIIYFLDNSKALVNTITASFKDVYTNKYISFSKPNNATMYMLSMAFCNKSQNTYLALPRVEKLSTPFSKFTLNSKLLKKATIKSKNILKNSELKFVTTIDAWRTEGSPLIDTTLSTTPLPMLSNGKTIGIGVVNFMKNSTVVEESEKWIEQTILKNEGVVSDEYFTFSSYFKTTNNYAVVTGFVQVDEIDNNGNVVNVNRIEKDFSNAEYYDRLKVSFKTFNTTTKFIVKVGALYKTNVDNTLFVSCPMLEKSYTATSWIKDDYQVNFLQKSRNTFDDAILKDKLWTIDNKALVNSLFSYGTVTTSNVTNSADLKNLGSVSSIKFTKTAREQSGVLSENVNYALSNPLEVSSSNIYELSFYVKTNIVTEIHGGLEQQVKFILQYLDESSVVLGEREVYSFFNTYVSATTNSEHLRLNIKMNDLDYIFPTNIKKLRVKFQLDNGWTTWDDNYSVDFYAFQLEKSTAITEWVDNYIYTVTPPPDDTDEPVVFQQVYIKNPTVYRQNGEVFFRYEGQIKNQEKIIVDNREDKLLCYILREDGSKDNILKQCILFAEKQISGVEDMLYLDESGLNPNTQKPIKVDINFNWKGYTIIFI